jgi:hypothetical protein
MLLFFGISGFWQTFDPEYDHHSKALALLSTIHKGNALKSGGTLTSHLLQDFILLMALCFILTTFLGVIMALKYGHSRKIAIVCLAVGVLCPLAMILFTYFNR